MFELKKNDRINELIAITKSNSGISGPPLAEAHEKLGEQLAAEAFLTLNPEDATVVAILRGGMFFAYGIYKKLGCKFQLYNPKTEVFVRPNTKHVILVDAVVNTGKTIRAILDEDMMVACCVIQRNAVQEFEKQLYTVRVSENAFVGAEVSHQKGGKGPDTTMRLFNLI